MTDDPDDLSEDGHLESPPELSPTENSMAVIRAEVDLRRGEQERRGDAFDTRAGLVIGAAGVLIGLTVNDPNFPQVLAQVAAVVAALAAGWSLKPRKADGIVPRALYTKYVNRPSAETQKTLLTTRIALYEADEKRLAWKVRRLRWAGIALIASVGLMLVSGIVNYATPTDEKVKIDWPNCSQEQAHYEPIPGCYGRPGSAPAPPPPRPSRNPDETTPSSTRTAPQQPGANSTSKNGSVVSDDRRQRRRHHEQHPRSATRHRDPRYGVPEGRWR